MLIIIFFGLQSYSNVDNAAFYFNFKNIKALSALVCSLHSSLSSETARADGRLYFHKFKVLSAKPQNVQVHGLCKSQNWNATNNFEMSTLARDRLVGFVDEYKFYVYFKNIKRVVNGAVVKSFVLHKISMFPSPKYLPDALADFLEPSLEKISVQKIIPRLSVWNDGTSQLIEFKSDEYNRSLLGFVMYESISSLFIDAVPTLNFHTGKYKKEKDKAQSVFFDSGHNELFGCSQFTDSTHSKYKITTPICRSLRL